MKIGLLNKWREISTNVEEKLLYQSLKRNEYRKIKNKNRNDLIKHVKIDSSQEEQIQNFYISHYGKKIDTRWHRLYQSFTGNFDKRYFPEIIFSTELEPQMSNRTIADLFTDKAMVQLLYSNIDGLYIPKTYVVRCSGIYYDGNRNVITSEEAKKIMYNCGKKIIKRTVNSSSGRGVLIINLVDGKDIKNNIMLDEIIAQFGDNFIVQELIQNNDEIANLFSKSLNTFRIITYILDGRLYHVPIALRIGKGISEVDNIHAGGMFVGVDDDGNLMDKAYTEFQNVYYEHPDTKIKFKGYKIKNIDKMIKIAYKCHGRTPHLRLISWDFTINSKNQITLIEVNLNGQSIWFPQMANGKSAFGFNTEKILEMLRKNKK